MDTLATTDDLAARLGRPLLDGEQTRAAALLADASALIRAYTGQDFDLTSGDTVTLRAQVGQIRLPQRPVVAVTSVVAVGAAGAPDIAIAGYSFDGVDLIRLRADLMVINLPEDWQDDVDSYPGTYRVTYDHGYATAPDDVVAVAAGMVLRTLTAPVMAGGLTGETIGPYSYRMEAGSVGVSVAMSPSDQQVLARYRRTSGFTMMSVR